MVFTFILNFNPCNFNESGDMFFPVFWAIMSANWMGSKASFVLIPMEAEGQQNHLKAYGITYWALDKNYKVNWLLNYRGGSFLFPDTEEIRKECQIRGVSFEIVADVKYNGILAEIAQADVNQDIVKLEKSPRIAVYSPKNKQPWDDAVTLAMTFAEIPYTIVYDEEILRGDLKDYDWLHLHHEDFTGQYGKFWYNYKNASWFKEYVRFNENLASKLGFSIPKLR